MSSTLSDFFGSGLNPEVECLVCGGGTEDDPAKGKLKPVIWDHFGPTHFQHEHCEIPPRSPEAERFYTGPLPDFDYDTAAPGQVE